MKRSLRFVLTILSCCVIAMCLGGISASAADYSFKWGKVKYEVIFEPEERGQAGAVRAVGLIKDCDTEEIKIPDEVYHDFKRYTVTEIGDSALFDKEIKHLILPSTITKVGEFAFAANDELEEIPLMEGCTEIGMGAFAYTGIESMVIPDSVTKIGKAAFYACLDLKSISLGAGLGEIGDSLFLECRALEQVTLSEQNEAFTLTDGILYNRDETELIMAVSPKKKVKLKNSVTKIADYAFEGNRNIETVTMGNGVVTVGDGAFFECTSLKSVKCSKVLETIGENCFYECGKLKTIAGLTAVKTIKSNAFQGCKSLTKIALPKTLKTMDGNVFAYCGSLSAIKIASGSKYTSKDGIIYADKGKTIISCPARRGMLEISTKVTKIGKWAFQGNGNLTALVIPKSVKKVNYGAFYGCSRLAKVRVESAGTDFSADNTIKVAGEKTSCAIFEGVQSGIVIGIPSQNGKAVTKLKNDLLRHCPKDAFIVAY